MSTEHSRSKIIEALLKQIRENVDELRLSELCELSLLLTHFGNTYEGIYDLIEPYILNKFNSLTEIDLMMAIRGFYNAELGKRAHILDLLENKVINHID
jgi:hypothetical protein